MPVIAVEGLTKRFGPVVAVDDVSFAVERGSVVGFLGPNGAGKTTTLRILLGLVEPTAGRATIDGSPYAALAEPMRRVGAALEAAGFHPGRRARDHLRVLARMVGVPESRADEALAQVALTDAADRRVGGFSMGMRQRLALASALVGHPDVLILDEPANGLDPEGIRWLRQFLRHFADQGGTVLVSSHVLSEVAQTVDHVVIIARGRLVTQATLEELLARTGGGVVRVRSPHADTLRDLLVARGVAAEVEGDGRLLATGTSPEVVGEAAAAGGVVVHEMGVQRSNLEEVFLELTAAGRPDGPPDGGLGGGPGGGPGVPA